MPPVRVEDDGAGDTSPATALFPDKESLVLGCLSANLLTKGDGKEGKREKSCFWKQGGDTLRAGSKEAQDVSVVTFYSSSRIIYGRITWRFPPGISCLTLICPPTDTLNRQFSGLATSIFANKRTEGQRWNKWTIQRISGTERGLMTRVSESFVPTNRRAEAQFREVSATDGN